MAKAEIRSDVTGAVWKLQAAVGDRVAEGDTIAVLESMKMEIPVLVESSGSIIDLRVGPGDTVSEGDVIAVVESQ